MAVSKTATSEGASEPIGIKVLRRKLRNENNSRHSAGQRRFWVHVQSPSKVQSQFGTATELGSLSSRTTNTDRDRVGVLISPLHRRPTTKYSDRIAFVSVNIHVSRAGSSGEPSPPWNI
jgi:hypothetical protein